MIRHATTVGRRYSNEDTFAIGTVKSGWYHSYVGLFDGHGGDEVSNMCRRELEKTLLDTNYDLRSTVLRLHDLTEPLFRGCGSTGIVALVGRSSVRIANVGDSSVFTVTADGTTTRLTKMHHPSDPEESANVIALGGEVKVVSDVSRVGGSLMVSRSIGDRYLIGVNHTPEISQHPLTRDHRWLVFVTDGVTDAFRDSTIGIIVSSNNGDPTELVRRAVDAGSMDNCTAVIVELM